MTGEEAYWAGIGPYDFESEPAAYLCDGCSQDMNPIRHLAPFDGVCEKCGKETQVSGYREKGQ